MFRSLAIQGSFVLFVGFVGFVVHVGGLDIANAVTDAWRNMFFGSAPGYAFEQVTTLASLHTLGTVLMWLGAALVVLDAYQRGVAKRWKE